MNFAERIEKLANDIKDLITNGMRSSSSLAVAEQTVTVEMKIVGYKVNFDNDNCASKRAALIELIPSDGKPMMTSASLTTNSNELNSRSVILMPIIINNHPAYEFRIASGSSSDLTTIQGGGSIPTITFKLEFRATSEFTTNLTYRTDH